MAQKAPTVAGVAVGSAVGHMRGDAINGGFGDNYWELNQAQRQSPVQSPRFEALSPSMNEAIDAYIGEGNRNDFQLRELVAEMINELLQRREEDTEPENPIPSIGQLADVLNFEEKLKVDKELQRKTVKYLSTIGGRNYGDTVRRSMREITSPEVWSQFSLKGRKGKRSLEKLTVYQVLIKAIMKSRPGTTRMDAESKIADTLKHAPGLVKKRADRSVLRQLYRELGLSLPSKH